MYTTLLALFIKKILVLFLCKSPCLQLFTLVNPQTEGATAHVTTRHYGPNFSKGATAHVTTRHYGPDFSKGATAYVTTRHYGPDFSSCLSDMETFYFYLKGKCITPDIYPLIFFSL